MCVLVFYTPRPIRKLKKLTSQGIEPWAPDWKAGMLALRPSLIHEDRNNSQVLIKVRNILNEFELVDWNFEEVLKKFCDPRWFEIQFLEYFLIILDLHDTWMEIVIKVSVKNSCPYQNGSHNCRPELMTSPSRTK